MNPFNKMMPNLAPHPDVDPMAVSMATQGFANSEDPISWGEDSAHAADVPPVTPDMNPYFAREQVMSQPSMGMPMGMPTEMGGAEMSMGDEMGMGAEEDPEAFSAALMGRMAQDQGMTDEFQGQVVAENEEDEAQRRKGGF